MMFFRKKAKLFGNNVEPSCEYCACGRGTGPELRCSLSPETAAPEPCARFRYDPLKRIPSDVPELEKHRPEEFSL